MTIGMTSAPSPDVADLFRDSNSSSTSKKIRDLKVGDEDGKDEDHDNAAPPMKPLQGLSETGSEVIAELICRGALVPRLGSEFWWTYGNKLRVFGTKTQVMQLGRDMEKTDETK